MAISALLTVGLVGGLIAAGAAAMVLGNKITKAHNDAAKSAQRQAASAERALSQAYRNAAKVAEQGIRSIEQADRTVVRSSRAVEDAQKAVDKARAAAVATAAQGARNIASAEDRHTSAVTSSVAARKKLNQAYKDSQRELDDLKMRLQGAPTDERGAVLAVKRAMQSMADLGKDGATVSVLDREEAQQAIDEALQNLDEVRLRNRQLREDVRESNEKGVEGSDQVVEAKEAVVAATKAESDAEKDVAQARADAATANAEAQDNILEAQNRLRDSQEDLRNAEEAAQQARIDAADANREAQEQILEAQLALADAMESVSEAQAKQNGLLARFVGWLQVITQPMQPALQAALLNLETTMNRLTPALQRVFGAAAPLVQPFSDALTGLIEYGLPGTEAGLRNMGPAIEGFRDGMRSLGGSIGTMFDGFGKGAQGIGDTWRYAGQQFGKFLELLGDFTAKFSTPASKSFDMLLGGINKLLEGMLNGLGPALDRMAGGSSVWYSVFENIGKLFEVAGPAIGEFSESLAVMLKPVLDAIGQDGGVVLREFLHTLAGLFRELTPLVRLAAEGFGWLVEKLTPVLPLVLSAYLGFRAMAFAFGLVQKAAMAFRAAMTALSIVMATNPWILAGIAIVGLVVAIVALESRYHLLGNMWEWVKEKWNAHGRPVWNQVVKVFHAVWEAWKRIWENNLKPALQEFWDKMQSAFTKIAKSWDDNLKPALADLWSSLVKLWPVIKIIAIVLGVYFALQIAIVVTAILILINIVVNVAGPAMSAWGDLISGLIKMFASLTGVMSGVVKTMMGVGKIVLGIIQGINRALHFDFTGAKNSFAAGFSQGAADIGAGFGTLKNAWTTGMSGLGDMRSGGANLGKAALGIGTGVKDGVTQAYDIGKGIYDSFQQKDEGGDSRKVSRSGSFGPETVPGFSGGPMGGPLGEYNIGPDNLFSGVLGDEQAVIDGINQPFATGLDKLPITIDEHSLQAETQWTTTMQGMGTTADTEFAGISADFDKMLGDMGIDGKTGTATIGGDFDKFTQDMTSKQGGLSLDLGISWSGMWDGIENKAADSFNDVTGRFGIFGEMMRNAQHVFGSLLRGDWSGMWDDIKTAADDHFGWISTGFEGFKNGFLAILGGLKTAAEESWKQITGIFARPINAVINIFNDHVADKIGMKDKHIPTIPGFKDGGLIPGAGHGRADDKIVMTSSGPIRASSSEFMVNAKATSKHLPLLNAINSGAEPKDLPRFQDGGLVGGSGADAIDWMNSYVKGVEPGMVLTSGLRFTDNGYHSKGLAADFAIPGASQPTAETLNLAANIAADWGGQTLELIHGGFGHNIKDGQDVGDGVGLYGAGTMSEHYNHVHWAVPGALSEDDKGKKGLLDRVGGIISGLGRGLIGGARELVSSVLQRMSDPLIDKIPDPFLDTMAGPFGSIPKSFAKQVQQEILTFVRGKEPKGSFGPLGGVLPEGDRLNLLKEAMALAHVPPPGTEEGWLRGMNTLVERESGWRTNAINLWDSNAAAGTPSKGLAQMIDPTFQAWKIAGHEDIWNPLDNLAASMRYIVGTYGSIENVQQANASAGPRGYAKGTKHAESGWALVGEEGPELVNFNGGEEVVPNQDIFSRLKDAATTTKLEERSKSALEAFGKSTAETFLSDLTGDSDLTDGFIGQLIKQTIDYSGQLNNPNVTFNVTDVDEALRKYQQQQREQNMTYDLGGSAS